MPVSPRMHGWRGSSSFHRRHLPDFPPNHLMIPSYRCSHSRSSLTDYSQTVPLVIGHPVDYSQAVPPLHEQEPGYSKEVPPAAKPDYSKTVGLALAPAAPLHYSHEVPLSPGVMVDHPEQDQAGLAQTVAGCSSLVPRSIWIYESLVEAPLATGHPVDYSQEVPPLHELETDYSEWVRPRGAPSATEVRPIV